MNGAHLPLNFQLIFTSWTAPAVAKTIRGYEAALPSMGWPNWVLGNHDQKRIATRIGPAQARIAAMLLLTLRGTPTLYYGDELGLQNVPIPTDRVQDPWERNEPGLGLGRDPARTPMPWEASFAGGFTTGKPWLPLNPDHDRLNVQTLSANERSILNLYRQLTALRRANPALTAGSLVDVCADGEVLAFRRRLQGTTLLVALNFGGSPGEMALPPGTGQIRLLLSSCLDSPPMNETGQLRLRANEGVVVELQQAPPA
jgi:alpha-glucosidase